MRELSAPISILLLIWGITTGIAKISEMNKQKEKEPG